MLRYFGSRVRLKFPDAAPYTAFPASPFRVISRDEEKEHRKVEAQLKAKHDDAVLVAKLVEDDPQLLTENLAFFKSKENAHKDAKIDEMFYGLEAEASDEEEEMPMPTTNDHEAGPFGEGGMNISSNGDFDDYLRAL